VNKIRIVHKHGFNLPYLGIDKFKELTAAGINYQQGYFFIKTLENVEKVKDVLSNVWMKKLCSLKLAFSAKQSFYSSPWFILFIVLLTSLAAPLNQFKVPPVMPLLMKRSAPLLPRRGFSCRSLPSPACFWPFPRGSSFRGWGIGLSVDQNCQP
jgi:hypothetical protein